MIDFLLLPSSTLCTSQDFDVISLLPPQIIIHESVPVQVDGEPWQQGPASLTISHQGQAHMLRKVEHDECTPHNVRMFI